MRFLRTALLLIPVFLACQGCEEPTAAPSLPGPTLEDDHLAPVSLDVLPPGIYPQKLVREDGTDLRYTISVPQGYSHAQGAPLILALHFGVPNRGQPAPPFYGRIMLEILVEPALQDLGAIIISPDSLARGWTSEASEEAVLQILDHVTATYNIDQSRTLVTGFSMGGRGTWHMAQRHPERFSAAIPIAARPPDEAGEWKIPLYVIHSRDDGLIPLAPVEARIAQLQADGADVQLVAIDGVPHHQTASFAEPLREAVPWIRKVWNEPQGTE